MSQFWTRLQGFDKTSTYPQNPHVRVTGDYRSQLDVVVEALRHGHKSTVKFSRHKLLREKKLRN